MEVFVTIPSWYSRLAISVVQIQSSQIGTLETSLGDCCYPLFTEH
jgi:hypothetical protein